MTYARLTRNAPWVRIVWILLAIVAVILLSRIITRTAGGDDFADAEAEMDGTNTTSRATVYLPTGTQER